MLSVYFSLTFYGFLIFFDNVSNHGRSFARNSLFLSSTCLGISVSQYSKWSNGFKLFAFAVSVILLMITELLLILNNQYLFNLSYFWDNHSNNIFNMISRNSLDLRDSCSFYPEKSFHECKTKTSSDSDSGMDRQIW